MEIEMTIRMKRAEMVIAGADKLFATEDAVDKALTETSELIALLMRMRVGNNLSGTYGQEAVKEIVGAAKALEKARTRMIRAHGHLDHVKAQLGCRTVMIGTELNKPVKGSAEPGATAKAVAEAA